MIIEEAAYKIDRHTVHGRGVHYLDNVGRLKQFS